MKKNSLPLLTLISLLLTAALFSGCRTMEGAGQDIENAGEEIQDSAR